MLLTLVVLLGYALVILGVTILLGTLFPQNRLLPPMAILLGLVLLALPIRIAVHARLSALFPRRQPDRQARLQAFSSQITQAIELSPILAALREALSRDLSSSFHIFYYDPLSHQYLASPDSSGKPSTDLRFPADGALARVLSATRAPIDLSRSDFLKGLPHSDQSRLALLGAQLLVPLIGHKQLAGWLALSPPISHDSYSQADLRYLQALCEPAAAALERSQVIAVLEHRVREMDVLTRVAQGVNITLDFDDLLELIYAQTSQVIPCSDFYVTLRHLQSDQLYYAFYLESDERLRERENTLLAARFGLEETVIRSQRRLITEDYHQECRRREVIPASHWLYAWMGVPLNAGAETIGVISMGSRDPMIFYTDQQADLLQAIADQAAGAIVKARLIEETRKRAHQLSTLYEIGRSLTSTLEVNSLLNQILHSAVEILNCEAGSLFMLDENSGELVFEVTVGPVAQDLVGQRLPPGTGIAGKCAQSGEAMIVNDARHSGNWLDQPDRQTGFVTRDILVVPMKVKEKIIGVIEIINKKDGSPFNPEDQELLTTFSSQAAIAIENARLYTQTDKALSARVEELSVMQRIDRELNASLELERVMRISLEWAMRQSGAQAGLVGLLENNSEAEEKRFRVISLQGFPDELNSLRQGEAGSYLPIERLPLLQTAVQEGGPQCALFLPDDSATSQPHAQGLLPGSIQQVVIPIRRKGEVIAAILLELHTTETISPEIIAFLSRLSDHAAIAISNAQLYADLQAANLAKSEFVSLVSHELKTPMTSIKGYADLLAKGSVGPINEIQANFLNTIRTNVNRMATLVSDLADVSRIEAGRMRLEFSAVDLGDVVSEVVRTTRAQIDEKSQSLELDVPPDLPSVWGDRNRLIQILANLISNANKYTPQGGRIRLSARQAANEWDPQGAPQVVCVDVADNGYGISPDDQTRIFQKFFRSEDERVREASGTGLGLNITRSLVEMQGGRIWFESEPGRGSTFTFTIPIAANAAD